MRDKLLRQEIDNMSDRIYELQQKSEHLTNGQRYAVINEIEKSIHHLSNDLRHLEHQFYTQRTTDETLQKDIQILEKQINDLENIKSDLTARINTETEHTRQELNDKIILFMCQALTPIKESIESDREEIQSIKSNINSLKDDIREYQKSQEIKEAAKFDRFKMILTAVVAALAAISTLSLWLEPSIRILMHIFFQT